MPNSSTASARAAAFDLPRCMTSGSATCVAHREHRVERGHRLLEDHRDLGRRGPRASRRSGSASRSRPRNCISPPTTRPGGSRTRPQDRQRGDRLAGARLADDAERARRRGTANDTPSTARSSPASVREPRHQARERRAVERPAGRLAGRISTRRRRSRRRGGSSACTDRTPAPWPRARRRGSCRSRSCRST